ncbi:hypothetical protein NDA11_000321 [Ustilago hordei]|uniref:DASH complex subunit DUO1 n=1 Tax=Ustilago hordei TaxID=120017 RepID=I2FNK1_USTHO|nr:uncharacterized protein UHO2_07211 [Ustilago hordei]KAJ1039649.1 hypothetical protein NDA10_006866 [Ustilago hordei]KAJ1570215.1 hypothetical protein NDA12_004321 [Ustilago hordei]KAJ1572211.1 hypothetical protein NDA15_007285 [Ustilago hordei]KAJ1574234.1 hypothetical protein NDA11_000321 [Ustilago hordei]KAJ1594560.1 hypothetical protein NDA14_000650 [Ustilago hordei]
MPTFPTTPKPSGADAADSSWLLDETLSPALVQGSMPDLNISDSPLHGSIRTTTSTNSTADPVSRVKKPMKSRPSWGSAAVLDANNSVKTMSSMRLLAGLDINDENKPSVSGRAPVSSKPAGAGRPRFSLFAKPGVPTNLMPKKAQQQTEPEDNDEDVTIGRLPDASILAPSPSALDSSVIDGDEEYIREALLGKRASARPSTGDPTPSESKESQQQSARQLAELRRMNDVFEGFEKMLRGSAGQINAFAKRVQETDDLLNIYIGLLRQTEKTQQLLQDQDWKGTTDDATAHALSVALAQRETQRLYAEAQARELEAQRAAEEAAAMQAEEEERRKLDELRRANGAGGRGRGRAVSGTRTATRGATARDSATSAIRGRVVGSRTAASTTDSSAPSSSTSMAPVSRGGGSASSTRGQSVSTSARSTARPSAIPTRAVSGSAGLGGQYANVKSSGYGPR